MRAAGSIATLTHNLQPMPVTVDITIEPNDKYDAVICSDPPMDSPPDTEEEWREQHPAPEAADAYAETLAGAPTPETDTAPTIEDGDGLISWDDFSVASDPDLVAKMATYFDGMTPDEPIDRLRAKLRLLDADVYANAQIASRAEIR